MSKSVHPATRPRARKQPVVHVKGNGRLVQRENLTIHDLGWTRQEAAKVRAQLASFAADWDSPAMDIYNEP